MSEPTALARLAGLIGIEAGYLDVEGRQHRVCEDTLRALLGAMGLDPAADPAQLAEQREAADWLRPLAPVQVHPAGGPLSVAVTLAAGAAARAQRWRLTLESGARHAGQFEPAAGAPLAERRCGETLYRRYALSLPTLDEPGYHRLELEPTDSDDRPPARLCLIVVPATCFQPEALRGARRLWGPAVQLYGLRSARNWGIGDFTDLRELIVLTAKAGGGLVGINPLHALVPDQPQECSPYYPSSRRFLNPLYLDVDAVIGANDAPTARALVAEPGFQARLQALRDAELVDYPAVAAVKLEALWASWQDFGARHLGGDSPRGAAFERFRAAGGEALRRHAVFEALQAHVRAADPAAWGWPAWPAQYRDPDGEAVRRFAEQHADAVGFRAYLQWLADEQLAAAGAESWQCGLGIGLYQDLAVGARPGGAETWHWRGAYSSGARLGAPPDAFNSAGQDWGLAPPLPHALRELAYRPIIDNLRAVMRHCGALRIDHVMGLLRLWWVPVGAGPADGAYVTYAFRDLLGILALESQRNRCLIIGEDLGTVPDGLRPTLVAAGVLGCRPLLFEHDADGRFRPPADYPAPALAAASTHDLPTLRGFWLGQDLRHYEALGLFATPSVRARAVAERAGQRAWLLAALEREQLLPHGTGIDPQGVPDIDPPLGLAVHRFLARTPCRALAVQPQDVFGRIEQDNLPGSRDGHPNWRRKLPVMLEAWALDARWQDHAAVLTAERGSGVWPREAAPDGSPTAVIPRATYRLQFNRDFTFAQATELVPYLAELGISHVYASPYLRARPGSTHGYDIVDHNALNPEVGSREDFERFAGALAAHGMGQILDVVPNHMGVMGADNQWWLDVLENGPASIHADHFDIDWQPLNPRLHGKVLLPILGDQYGVVLARGELCLTFDAARGEFSIAYYQHRLPLDPASYPQVAGHQPEQLAAMLGADHEQLAQLQSLLTAFGHLPPRDAGEPRLIAERNRDKEVHKRNLAALCEAQPAIRQHLERAVAHFNGRAGEPESFDPLHALIRVQAWRPAYWRVASDEINYRRFFDINDLAGLRMENPAVFDATHRLVLELIAEGRLHGLRIDHPDGLNDPRAYFERLQAAVRERAGTAEPRPLYLVVEKILAEHERLPEDWPVHGTTGYRFGNLVGGLFVDPAAERRMARIYQEFARENADFETLVYDCKKLILRTALASELNVLANRLARIAAASRDTCDFTVNGLRGALAEVLACFPVYRTYVTEAPIAVADRRHVDWAVAVARRRSRAADIGIFEFLHDVLTLDIATGRGPSYRDQVLAFVLRFQQLSAPVMAKGLEDTAFYRHHRLVSLNEVGGDPRRFGVSIEAFHNANRSQARHWPQGLLATSTHDSKRAEDVRARIGVLSELPAVWKLAVRRWQRQNRRHKRAVDDRPAPSAGDEYLLYQTLVGSFPLGEPDAAGLADYRARVAAFLQKAVREAKAHSSWINPSADYEAALSAFVEALLTPAETNSFLPDLRDLVQRLAGHGLRSALAQVLLKLTAPGVPDLYQGSELWQFRLVDPDNRAAVDYALRRRRLGEIKTAFAGDPDTWPARLADLAADWTDGRLKLYLTWRALRLRARCPALFRDGDYRPLATAGAGADRLCAFARSLDGQTAVTVVPRLLTRLLEEGEGAFEWADTRISLPPGDWYDLLSGRCHHADDTGVAAQTLLDPLPLALLVDDRASLAP